MFKCSSKRRFLFQLAKQLVLLLLAITLLLSVAFICRISLVVREWESLGGTVGVDDSPLWGPRSIQLGNAIGHPLSADFQKILASLHRMRTLPICDELSVAHLSFEHREICMLIEAFNPAVLQAEDVNLTDADLERITSSGRIQRISLGKCPVTNKGVEILLSNKMIKEVSVSNLEISRKELKELSTRYGNRLIIWN